MFMKLNTTKKAGQTGKVYKTVMINAFQTIKGLKFWVKFYHFTMNMN